MTRLLHPHVRLNASAHLIDKFLIFRQKLYQEIRNIQCTGGQGSEALRRDELKKRLENGRRERLEICFSGGRNIRWV